MDHASEAEDSEGEGGSVAFQGGALPQALPNVALRARRFDSMTFDASEEFFRAAQADPNGEKGRTYNSFRGLRWSPEVAQRLYARLTPEQRGEADRRASLILDHIKFEACRGDLELLTYLLRWVASLVRRPGRRMLTMLVFVGDSGCGKTVVGQNVLGPLFGHHYGYNSDLGDLLGKFNARVADTILAWADEARVRAGSREAAQLKALITESHGSLRAGRKGRDIVYANSFCNLIGAVEDMSELGVDLASRRFIPFHLAGSRRGQKPYFDALVAAAQDDNRMGLLAFLVKFLLEVDLGEFDRGQTLPQGRGEVIRSLIASGLGARDSFREWIRMCVDRGYIVPRKDLDDLDVLKNEHVQWVDLQGRTLDTRSEPWITELPSETVYNRFRHDMHQYKMQNTLIKKGLKRGGFLHPECPTTRRRVSCEVRTSLGVCSQSVQKTYLILLQCEQYERMRPPLQRGSFVISDGERYGDPMLDDKLTPPLRSSRTACSCAAR